MFSLPISSQNLTHSAEICLLDNLQHRRNYTPLCSPYWQKTASPNNSWDPIPPRAKTFSWGSVSDARADFSPWLFLGPPSKPPSYWSLVYNSLQLPYRAKLQSKSQPALLFCARDNKNKHLKARKDSSVACDHGVRLTASREHNRNHQSRTNKKILYWESKM